MSIILTVFDQQPFLMFPTTILGWMGLITWAGVIGYLLYTWRNLNKPLTSANRFLVIVFLFLVPLTNLFIGARLPVWNKLPLPEMTITPLGFAVMFFSAVPWVLAAGFLGPFYAAVFGTLSGVLSGIFGTHSVFTVVETAALAVSLSFFLNQNYRTLPYRVLRHPLVGILTLCILYPIPYSINTIFITAGSLTGQIDYAFSNVPTTVIVVSVPLLIAGLLASILRGEFPDQWGGQPPWQLAPFESSLEARFLRSVIPIWFLLMIALSVGDWVFAGRSARKILEGRMASVAQIAAEGVPYYLNTGHTLALQIANEIQPDLPQTVDLGQILQDEILSLSFFHELYVLDQNLESIDGYPVNDFYEVETSMDELAGIKLALAGVPVQYYPLQPTNGESSGMITFITAMKDSEEVVQGVLVARTDFIKENPFAKPILTSLDSLTEVGGLGFLTDETGRILYHPDPNYLNQIYPLRLENDRKYYDETAPDGTRQVTYFQRAVGQPWVAVTTLPASEFQESALKTAAPLLGMVVILSIVAVLLIRVGLKAVTGSLKSLAVEADRIAQGQLDSSFNLVGDDEVGKLRRSFEKMRISLKDRLDELNRLLEVSQGVLSSLEMKDAVRPILEAALATGASSVRIVLTQAIIRRPGGEAEMPSRFGLGEFSKTYSRFDDQLLAVMENQERIVLSNPSRTTLLSVHPGVTRPKALVAVSLRHEDQYYGTLWVAYATPHPFTSEEVRFLTTLGSQAAVAAANTRLFWTAEFGRQQLAAILSSTPDPVIVTDHENHLLLVNPAAIQALNLSSTLATGEKIDKIISSLGLIKLLKSESEKSESIEITLPDHCIYRATASPILSEGFQMGTVCVLRDITHYKELDDLKSEFVATVSHDLKSPLTFIRGYATMLDMVGKLNEQQENYVRRIVSGVDGMKQLITNLLDLGRIEAKIGLKLEKLSVREVLGKVIETFQMPATQKQIKLHLDYSQVTNPIVEADRSMLEQAFHNLLENAIKYTPSGKEIWVRVFHRKDQVIFEFRDTGIGISSVDIPRVFEKFYRSSNREAKKQRGTGLGLAIVKSIAIRHHGKVWVESKLGRGSAFFFAIPIAQKNSGKGSSAP